MGVTGNGENIEAGDGDVTRSRIIEATFHVLMERGYAGASTREIARRARVSKRELYALFDSKDGILAAMIGGRAARMRQPLALPDVVDRDALAETLRQFAISLLREGSKPEVMAVFRLAIAEAERGTPDLARRLDTDGRQPTRARARRVSWRAPRNGGCSAATREGDGDAVSRPAVGRAAAGVAAALGGSAVAGRDRAPRRAPSRRCWPLHPPPAIPAR